ncbi:MAG: RlmE family RNA methyltransferase [Candidatus Eisenbacteria bacterium]
MFRKPSSRRRAPGRWRRRSRRQRCEPLRPEGFFFRRAKREGYAARSLYKLEEIDRKHRLIRPGDRVVDLGCAPGSWLQYVSRRVGPEGLVVGVDIEEVRIALPPFVRVLRADLLALEPEELLAFAPRYDLLLSDAAPKTTGVPFADHARSVELARKTLELARAVVRPGGGWLCKVFQGEELESFRREARLCFDRLLESKPKSSRDRSNEVFLLGLGLAGGPEKAGPEDAPPSS